MPSTRPTVCLVSLGCPKNLVDSERILAILAEGGCTVGAPIDDADVIVVNTCGFLDAARAESLEVIQEALDHKRRGRARRIVVAGCLATRDGSSLYELASGIDAVVGVNDREEILKAVLGRRRRTLLSPAAGVLSDAGRFRLTPPHTAYLRIAEGCSQRCSFCTIPSIRGPLRSKPLDQVLAEAAELVEGGAIELNVIAQDTTAWGSDLPDRPHLHTLLRRLNDLDGVRWIRLLYTYPRRFGQRLIDAMAACDKVVPYVDMPLQHIDDGILRRMGRGVKRADVERLLGDLREAVPDLAIRTTLIVGFPGETDAQFKALLDFVRCQQFEALGAFAYSPEEGTPAAVMAGQVDEAVKRQRVEQLMLLQQEIAFRAAVDRVGSQVEVLVDGFDPEGRCIGRHAGQAPDVDGVCFLTEPVEAGSLLPARVVEADGYDLVVEAQG